MQRATFQALILLVCMYRVYVALQHKVYVYNFSDAGLICHFETLDNPQGASAPCVVPFSQVTQYKMVDFGVLQVFLQPVPVCQEP